MKEEITRQSLFEKQPANPLTQHISEKEIRRLLLLDVLQAKSWLMPMGLSMAGLIYSFLYAPILGGFLIGVSVSVFTAFIGISVFIWRYVICFPQNYAMKSQELVAYLQAQNQYLEERRLAQTHAVLDQGLSAIKATGGLYVLRKLDHEYNSLGIVLSSAGETDLLSSSSIVALVKETYYRGLSVLQDVFELERAIQSTNQTQLQEEISELQRKLSEIHTDPFRRDLVAQITERIASNQERLHLVNELKRRVEGLLYQAQRCEASLGKTRIELAALKADGSDISVNAVIETLRKTIDRAREVQEELKQLGY